MTPEQKIIAFLKAKVAQWGPDPVAYVQRLGVDGLAAEFGADPGLSQFCGWLRRPMDAEVIGGVEQFIREENPALGYVVTILVQALVDSCAERHQLNKTVATRNIQSGAGVVSVASLFVGLVMLFGGQTRD